MKSHRFAVRLFFYVTAVAAIAGPEQALALASDECIEKGGPTLCVPTNFSSWCYTINPGVGYPPLRSMGAGYVYYCYLSEQEAFDAFLSYYTAMQVGPVLVPTRPLGFVNGQVVKEMTRYQVSCVPGKPGTCGLIPALDVDRHKGTPCAVQGTIAAPDDPANAPHSGYPGYRQVCPVFGIKQNEQSCPVGSSVYAGEARKTENEVDYEADGVGALEFERTYDSGAMTATAAQFLGDKWSTNHASTLSPVAGAPGASVIVRFGNGAIEAFKTAGTSFESAFDAKGRVANQVDSGGNTIAWNHYGSDGRLRHFGADGKLLAAASPGGRTVRYSYVGGPGTQPLCQVGGSVGGALQCITDDFDRQLNFEYDSSGRLSTVKDPSGGLRRYGYNETGYFRAEGASVGVLTSVLYPDGSARYYHYNEVENTGGDSTGWLLTGISERTSSGTVQRFATSKYDTSRRPVSISRAGGVATYGISYPSSFSRVVTDPLGTSRTITLQLSANAFRQKSVAQPAGAGSSACSDLLTYDSRANVASRTDFRGNKTCYAYDLSRNLETKRVEGVAAGIDCATALSSPPTGSRVISTQWHPDWRFETRIAEPNKITTLTYNGQGASCAPSTVLVDGKPPAVVCSKSEQATTDASGALGFGAGLTGTARNWSTTYTTYGRVLTATDPNGKVTQYTYYADDDADLGRRGNVATVTNAATHVTRLTAYNLHGQPTQIVDPNGLVTDLTYDLRQRPTSRKVGNELTTFNYEPTGLLKTVTLPDGASLTYSYDAAHRLVAIADQQGSRIDYTLDAMGNRLTERATGSGGSLVRNIQRTIDALNRVQQIVGAQ